MPIDQKDQESGELSQPQHVEVVKKEEAETARAVSTDLTSARTNLVPSENVLEDFAQSSNQKGLQERLTESRVKAFLKLQSTAKTFLSLGAVNWGVELVKNNPDFFKLMAVPVVLELVHQATGLRIADAAAQHVPDMLNAIGHTALDKAVTYAPHVVNTAAGYKGMPVLPGHERETEEKSTFKKVKDAGEALALGAAAGKILPGGEYLGPLDDLAIQMARPALNTVTGHVKEQVLKGSDKVSVPLRLVKQRLNRNASDVINRSVPAPVISRDR